MQKQHSFVGWVLLVVFIAGVGTPGALLIWRGLSTDAVLRHADVGRFIAADAAAGGLFTPTVSTVRTSTSSITVTGTFSTSRGATLVLEDMSKTGLHLCVAGAQASCVEVVGRWSGELKATAAAGHAFDFDAHGLTGRALGGWLVMGLFLCIVCLITIGIRAADEERRRAAGGGE